MFVLSTLKQRQKKSTACGFYYDKETITCGVTAFDEVAEAIIGITVKKFSGYNVL